MLTSCLFICIEIFLLFRVPLTNCNAAAVLKEITLDLFNVSDDAFVKMDNPLVDDPKLHSLATVSYYTMNCNFSGENY